MGLRPGTVALPLAVGFAEAARLATNELGADTRRIAHLRDLKLLENLQAGIPGLAINGSRQNRVAGNLNITVPDVLAEDLMLFQIWRSLPARPVPAAMGLRRPC